MLKIILFLFFPIFLLSAEDFPGENKFDFETPAGSIESNCNSTESYNEISRITFYGDSRLDYADTYSHNLLYYINNEMGGQLGSNPPSFGIQNFGNSSWTTGHLNGHLLKCLKNGNYKTSNRFVVNIGGNDWFFSSIYILAQPWIAVGTALFVENNVRGIVGYLKQSARLFLLLSLFLFGCQQKSSRDQILDELGNPYYIYLLLSEMGILSGGCEGENQRFASFFPVVGKETIIDIGRSQHKDYYLQIVQNKGFKVIYTPVDSGCIYSIVFFNFCNGLFREFPNPVKCYSSKQANVIYSEIGDFQVTDGPVTCKIDPASKPLTSVNGTIGINYKSVATKCKISILINYE